MTSKLLTGLLIILQILVFSGLYAKGQSFYQDDFSRLHFYGTYIGVELGLVNQFEGSALAGYKITPRWHAGIGAKYQYYHDRRFNQVFRAHIFGPLALTDFVVIKDMNEFMPFRFIDGAFFIHAEMNYFSMPVRHFDLDDKHAGKNRFFRPSWLTGVGLRRQAGPNRFFHVLVMFDISDHSRPVYSNPVVRFGLMF